MSTTPVKPAAMAGHPIDRRRAACGMLASVAGLAVPMGARAAGPVKIGFVGPLSGPLARVGETNRNCLLLAVNEINAAGGLLGQKIEVIAEDSQMSSKVTLDKARKLVMNDSVAMLTGMVLPMEREAALQAVAGTDRLVVFPNFDEGRCHPQLLTTGLASNQRVEPLVEWVVSNVGKTMYIIASDFGTTRYTLIPQVTAALQRHGGRLMGVRFFPFGTRDFAPTLQQVQSLGPELVWHSIGDDPITFVKQYHSFGMKPQLVTDITHESLALATEGASAGNIGVSPYFMSVAGDANKRFLDGYTRQFADSTPLRIGSHVVMLPHGESTYVGAKLFAAAAKAAGSVDGAKVKAALAGVTLAAPRGEVRVAPGGGHLLCQSLIARAKPDSSFALLSAMGPVAPQCAAAT
ncbi:ABC transporter substrate-binding protein [Aquabacterium humicola]|uniref:ABC transporter substrate-binding protein n=1 Tax=Aquabacterium humicola TaxID=3237377 RepID=UPI002542C747|nr:ABC transporter substrate-binding protein [Rubrivivax pictus]